MVDYKHGTHKIKEAFIMDVNKLIETRGWVREELARCVDFWLKNGMDPVNGGVYTCLDRRGDIFSTDKSVCLALIDSQYAALGTDVEIQIRKKTFPGTVCKKRFYDKHYKKN